MNALEIRNLTKSFKDFRLDNLSLTLPSGCIMGLIGENGAGKSTTIKLILDIIHKDGGSIKILGEDNEKNIKLTYTEAATTLIAKKSFSRKFGARNMRRYIQKEVEDRLAGMIIADYRRFYSFVKIDSDGENIVIHCL